MHHVHSLIKTRRIPIIASIGRLSLVRFAATLAVCAWVSTAAFASPLLDTLKLRDTLNERAPLMLVDPLITSHAYIIKWVPPFRAPYASVYEARIATIIQPEQKKLRLDIGASVDLMSIDIDTLRPPMKVGVDFMTYTRLRSEHNLKFPVETIDYWFGVHATCALTDDIALRLRAAHISSHLVDGMADTVGLFSVQKPFVYSREFLELLGDYNFTPWLRGYVGGTVVTSTQPRSANRLIPQVGIDVDVPVDESWSLRGGFDWRLVGIDDVYVTAQAAQIGIFYATNEMGDGMLLSAYGYNGRSMHGMFFNQADAYFGLGLQIIW